jgi:hypothetical protein
MPTDYPKPIIKHAILPHELNGGLFFDNMRHKNPALRCEQVSKKCYVGY